MTSRLFRCALALVTFCAVSVCVHSEPAVAASCTINGSTFDGYDGYASNPVGWSQTPEGVSSYIVTHYPATCSTYPSNFSTAWVMLQDEGSSYHYAQAGYIYDNSCYRYFTEWNISGPTTFYRQLGACAPNLSVQAYYVEYTGNAGPHPSGTGTESLVSPGLLSTMPYDIWQLGWNFMPDYLGETKSTSDDMPGSATNKATFSAMGIQSVSNSQLISTPCYLKTEVVASSRYHAGAAACDNTSIWTDPLS
jgi:hypothetical protein